MEDRPEPKAVLVLTKHSAQRRVEADLRVQVGPLGSHLVSHQAAQTPDQAVHLAVTDIERQLDRQLATMRGDPSFGVPSRRLPKHLRPNPPEAGMGAAEAAERTPEKPAATFTSRTCRSE